MLGRGTAEVEEAAEEVEASIAKASLVASAPGDAPGLCIPSCSGETQKWGAHFTGTGSEGSCGLVVILLGAALEIHVVFLLEGKPAGVTWVWWCGVSSSVLG